jgi:hypothetical protein
MRRVREQARESHGVDIAREGWKEQFKQERHDDTEARLLIMRANDYLVYSQCQTKLEAYAADKSLSSEKRAAKVCKVGVEALRGRESVLLHNLQELQHGARGEAESLVKDVLAQWLAGELATRISIRTNKRLAKALDDIRGHNKPARRERFEALLQELYARAPARWADHHVVDWQLEATRNAVVKEIEQCLAPRADRDGASLTEEQELAAFVEREKALKAARDAGLPPREYELFALVMNTPRRFLNNDGKPKHREIAQELGIAVGTSKSLWSRIMRTLSAA